MLGLIPNYWKHLLWTETFQKSLLHVFCYNNKVTRQVKDLKKPSNKDIYCSLQSNSAKYNKPLKFIFWPKTSLKDTIFSVLISGVKKFLTG